MHRRVPVTICSGLALRHRRLGIGPHSAVALAVGLALLVAGCTASFEPTATRAGSELRFHWVVPDGFPATVSLHQALDTQPTGETRAYAPGGPARVGQVLSDGVLRGRLDEARRLVLKVDNHSKEPLRFWVAPHLPQPHEGDSALMVQCLCTGEVYEVPAGGSWTRVIEFGIRRRGAVTPLGITHVIVLGEVPR